MEQPVPPTQNDSQFQRDLDSVMGAVAFIIDRHKPERYMFLTLAGIAFIVLIGSILKLVFSPAFETATLAALFGSTGIVTASAGAVGLYLNKAYQLIHRIVDAHLRREIDA